MVGSTLARRLVLRAAKSAALERAAAALEHVATKSAHFLPVLAYHRIADPSEDVDLNPILISATPEAFEAQIGLLAAAYRPISLDELLAVRRREAELEPGSVMVTFDDAYRDFATAAWPVLRRHGVPVTLFVSTGYPDRSDRPFWWDRLYEVLDLAAASGTIDSPVGRLEVATREARARAYRLLRERLLGQPLDRALDELESIAARVGAPSACSAVLRWDELRELASQGVDIASHTRNHRLLDRAAVEDSRQRSSAGSMIFGASSAPSVRRSPTQPGCRTRTFCRSSGGSGSRSPSLPTGGVATTYARWTGCESGGSS